MSKSSLVALSLLIAPILLVCGCGDHPGVPESPIDATYTSTIGDDDAAYEESSQDPVVAGSTTIKNTEDETLTVKCPDPEYFEMTTKDGVVIEGGSEIELAPGETLEIDMQYSGKRNPDGGRVACEESENATFSFSIDNTSFGALVCEIEVAINPAAGGVCCADEEGTKTKVVGDWQRTDITVADIDVTFGDDGSFSTVYNGDLSETGLWSLDGCKLTRTPGGGVSITKDITELTSSSMTLAYYTDQGTTINETFTR